MPLERPLLPVSAAVKALPAARPGFVEAGGRHAHGVDLAIELQIGAEEHRMLREVARAAAVEAVAPGQAAAAQPLAQGSDGAHLHVDHKVALRRADAAWRDLRTRRVWGPRPECGRITRQKLESPPEVDVAVCGGTLGIFLACSLQQRGESTAAAVLAAACPAQPQPLP